MKERTIGCCLVRHITFHPRTNLSSGALQRRTKLRVLDTTLLLVTRSQTHIITSKCGAHPKARKMASTVFYAKTCKRSLKYSEKVEPKFWFARCLDRKVSDKRKAHHCVCSVKLTAMKGKSFTKGRGG